MSLEYVYAKQNMDEDDWDRVIVNQSGIKTLKIQTLVEYKDLIVLFVKRDFVTYYKQTILGPFWYVIQAMLSTVMYMLIFGNFAKIGTDGIPQPLFYFSGTILWTYFSENVKNVSNVFFQNKQMFSKVYFPRLVVPLSSTISLLIKFGIQFAMFALVYLYYVIIGAGIEVSWRISLFPICVLWLCILSCGTGMVVSSITTKYRDVALVLDFLVSLWMYATPVVFPLSEVPTGLNLFIRMNPVTVPFELFRYCFFGVQALGIKDIIYCATSTVILSICGFILFEKNERTFVDVI